MLSKFWLISAGLFMSFAWLIPNHTLPWTAFHSDAWAAIVVSMIALWVAWSNRMIVGWNISTLIVAAVCLLPWCQFAIGGIYFFGTAWINSLYLVGFLVAIRVGESLEANKRGQAGDFVFLAVAVAAVVSVCIQLSQWFGLPAIGPWTLNVQFNARFYANLAQPNQLATLLLLGVVGVSWAYVRKVIITPIAIFFAVFLLFGIVLTESRTAWLNIALLLTIAVVVSQWLPKKYLLTMFGLAAVFILGVVLLPDLNQLLGNSGADVTSVRKYRSLADPGRLLGWQILTDASFKRPLMGFGWGQLAAANFLVIGNYPGQPGLFLQSHNLLLDLILWNGYPVGLLLIAVIFCWVWMVLRTKIDASKRFQQLHMLAFVMILGVHAMLEYPLHYAYFLLPFGIIVGAVQCNLGLRTVIAGNRYVNIIMVVMVTSALIITVRDYFRVEQSFYGLRFEMRNIQTNIPKTPPDVLVLNQFFNFMQLARNTPEKKSNIEELTWMQNTVATLPSDLGHYKYAANLALNGWPREAQQVLVNLCKTKDANCRVMRTRWQSEKDPAISQVAWPQEFFD